MFSIPGDNARRCGEGVIYGSADGHDKRAPFIKSTCYDGPRKTLR